MSTEQQQAGTMHVDSVDKNEAKQTPQSPFITTSDIIRHLNESLQGIEKHNPLHALVNEDGDDDDKDNNNNKKKKNDDDKPQFELQTKLPDGSCRRARPDERAAADFSSKLQQAADFVHNKLQGPEAKLQWAEQQRILGNEFYSQQQYEQAVDIYLTCLVVAQPKMKLHENGQDSTNDTAAVDSEKDWLAPEFRKERLFLFVKVMNNLAQTVLQLGRYQKTITFCTMALQHCLLEDQYDSLEKELNASTLYCQQISKLFFKRGKAHRLRGEYKLSKSDLEEAHAWLDGIFQKNKDSMDVKTVNDCENMLRSINRELQLLSKALKEAKRNKQRQEKGMKRILGNEEEVAEPKNESSNKSVTFAKAPPEKLYEAEFRKRRRAYSTLRASKKKMDSSEDRKEDVTYTEWYIAMMGRVAQIILKWIGDDEEEENNHRVTNKSKSD